MPLRGNRVQQRRHIAQPDPGLGVREPLYADVRQRIGQTPFVEVQGLELPRGCRVWAKEEYRNPTGSHYDREMWRFLRELEASHAIIPGKSRMLETTTGNSGASFAWLCRVLGYPAPSIIIPEDMPRARIAQIKSYGADVILSPAGEYITGISKTFQRVMPEMTEAGYSTPQHWNDEYHCVAAMSELGEEIVANAEHHSVEFDYFMLALGNGGSARGVGSVLRGQGVTLLGVEPSESPIVAEYQKKPPGEHWESEIDHVPHGIIGTGPFRASEIYRNMKQVVKDKLLEDILHPSSEDARLVQEQLMDRSVQHVGMSSAAVIWAVKEYIGKNNSKRKTFGVIFYDPAWKYL